MAQLLYNSGEVVGAFFLEAEERSHAQTCPPHTTVTVERDADNEYDKYAVRVLADGIRIGYIPKDVAPAIALFLDNGYVVTGEVTGRIGKRSRGNQPTNPSITLVAVAP